MSDAARRAGPSGPVRSKEAPKVKFSPQAIEVADKVLDKPFSTEVWFRTGRDEKRTPSFRGKELVQVLLKMGIEYDGTKAVDEETAILVAEKLLNAVPSQELQCLFFPVEVARSKAPVSGSASTPGSKGSADPKGAKEKKGNLFVVVPAPITRKLDGTVKFDPEGRYCRLHETKGAKFRTNLTIAAVIALVIVLCMYPLWPMSVRVVIWYIAVTLLLIIVGLITIQLTVFCTFWLFGFDFWVLPNLWADVYIWDLFKPAYTFEKSEGVSMWTRLAVLAVIFGLGVTFYSQMPDLNEFIEQQKQFVEDIYAGTLLGDGSDDAAGARPGIGARDKFTGFGKQRRGPAIPNIDELDNMFAQEITVSVTPTPTPEAHDGPVAEDTAGPDFDALLDNDGSVHETEHAEER